MQRYFTNLDKPVFALINLPEVVKGALFARYSRTHKSLRRLFLDEFADGMMYNQDHKLAQGIGVDRAERLYDKVFVEYGDDSVAQLGGAHLACEQASNILTKVLEWGRLMAYLEQSTRYIDYQSKLGNHYRYFRDPTILESSLGDSYTTEMDNAFKSYGETLSGMEEYYRANIPQKKTDSDAAYQRALKAAALDASRGILPAGTISNLGLYGTGQSYEMLLMRMNASSLPEVRQYSQMMLTELRKVIPAFLKRVDVSNRGMQWSEYMGTTNTATKEIASELFADAPIDPAPRIELVDFDSEAETKLVASALYPHSRLSERAIYQRVLTMSTDEKLSILKAFAGDRANRRHKPGRALERPFYRFDILSDYGAFRDLQRHRMLSMEWQPLCNLHGFEMPTDIADANRGPQYEQAMQRSSDLYDTLVSNGFEDQAPYAIALAYRLRYSININARAAMHLIELRTMPQGHDSYRQIAQQMWELIRDEAKHHAIAAMMTHVDFSNKIKLGRLKAEERTETKLN